MKIHYISDSAIPSASPNSVHVMKMCQAFGQLGHTVTLEAKNTTACFTNIENPHKFYNVEPTFQLFVFPKKAFRGSGLSYNALLPVKVLRSSADLIYTRSILAACIALTLKKKVVFEMHEPFIAKGFRLNRMFRFIAEHKTLKKLVVISDALRQHLLASYKIKAETIFVAHDGADPIPKVQPKVVDNRFSVGYIGSLYPGKGMEILLPLAQRCQDISFHIVGGLPGQIKEWKTKAVGLNNLLFHGFKTQKELPAYITSFDLLIAPYSDKVTVSEKKRANNLALWMSPLKLFEYMSAGKPIVATDLLVIREILKNGHTALLCKADDLSEWERAVNTIRLNRTIGNELGKNAQAEFELRYTWYRRAENILNSLN